VNGLEERLRSELQAESGQITPGSLAGLRLPEPGRRGPAGRRPSRRWLPGRLGGPGRPGGLGGPWRWPGWAVPVAAAAAVVAVITGTVALVHTPPASPGGPAAAASPPAYYAYGVPDTHPPGTGGTSQVPIHSIAVRSVVTGGLVTNVTVPRPFTNVVTLTAAAGASVFVFSADRWRWRGGDHGHPGSWGLDRRTPLTFFVLRITRDGHTRLATVGQTVPLRLLNLTSIALSPDGRRLAMASVGGDRTALVRLITLGTGAVRTWTLPHASWQPMLQPAGAWTADGRTLVILMNGTHLPPRGSPPTAVRLLDTGAPGTSLAASRQLNLHVAGGNWAWRGIFITPDGSELLDPVVHDVTVAPQSGHPANGFVAVYSARTGALLRAAGGWTWHRNGGAQQVVLWSSPSGDRLLVLQPRPSGVTLGVLAGGSFRLTGAPLPRLHSAYQAMRNALVSSLAPYPAGLTG
jgi:hypothetical protein